MIALLACIAVASPGMNDRQVLLPLFEGGTGLQISSSSYATGAGLELYGSGSLLGLATRNLTDGRISVGEYWSLGAGIGGQSRPADLGAFWGEFRIDLGVQAQVEVDDLVGLGFRWAMTGQWDSARPADDDPAWFEAQVRVDEWIASVILPAPFGPIPGQYPTHQWGASARWVFLAGWFGGVRLESIREESDHSHVGTQVLFAVGGQY